MDDHEERDTHDMLCALRSLEREIVTVRSQGGEWKNSDLYRAHMSRALKKLSEARGHLEEAMYWANDGSEAIVRDSQLPLPFSEEVPF